MLFAQALGSVLAQTCRDVEIIVVNDGSAIEHQPAYQSVVGAAVSTSQIRCFSLIPRPKGHGQSFALNFGVEKATAPYVCFVDDDDLWIDPNHLARTKTIIESSQAPVDVYLANQIAFLKNEQKPGPIWVEDLPAVLRRLGKGPDQHGAHTVTVDDLLQSRGFCHLNTLIVRRALYDEIGGMEETIRWECDHDLYLRLIDRGRTIKYMPVTVARHNIPDPGRAASMTTSLSEIERRLFQLMVFYRAQYLCSHLAIRAHARRHATYTLKRISETLAESGSHIEAAFYAREALGTGPTFKWALYTVWRVARATVDWSLNSRYLRRGGVKTTEDG
jgi:Glycosyl transferase family 2